MPENPRLTIVLRDDLDLSPPKLAVQVGHAVDLVWLNRDLCGSMFDDWLDPEQGDRRKIILKISSLEKLTNLYMSLADDGAKCKKIVDSAYTELDEPTVTGLVVLPTSTNYKKLKRLRLYS